MEDKKIKSISEAFSMQPVVLEIMNQAKYENYFDKPNACKEIKLERLLIGHKCGNPVEEIYYVGYNFEGQKIFQYIANTVNVHFEN
ncbi:MAG TPA: hypothetical protein VNX68_04550 [Nitrosopumilaceae archaeon]|jgi:hypothetical protein|nr:hypothetical protein [Nitrosopumilaceae archaeon]